MTAKDYLTALKVIREIQRKQAYCSGQSKPYLADTLKEIEMYCPLDFSKSGGIKKYGVKKMTKLAQAAKKRKKKAGK